MSAVPGLHVHNVEGAFDLATTFPYLWDNKMAGNTEDILICRFDCATEAIQDALGHFLTHQPRLADKHSKCHIHVFGYVVSGRRISAAGKPCGKSTKKFIVDVIIYSRLRTDHEDVMRKCAAALPSEKTVRYTGEYDLPYLPQAFVRAAYDDYLRSLEAGFAGY